ncbi:Catechol 2,3-dioxygenase [Algoriphagus alkaliphilus]|uniref:Catechol 2,3-dioxygenase n=1 Tax=Algoriphagus alkaliphilus TaxID=279824 RepID=A0A1G5WFN6_9BACT|nr:VOC family protein [Algoriphagus alkaliphilus]SDA56938.1 Catechol 2,3-dioxygenase [Algoriphagus alkaliphilus]
MKSLLTISLYFLVMSSFAQIKVNHIAVHVSNLKKSMSFYQDVLALQEIEEPFKDGLHAWYDIGGGAALHLIEAPNIPKTVSKVNHLCFSIPDMKGFIENMNAKSYPFESWAGVKGEVTNRVDGIKQIYIQDPDGYWLEINDDYGK